MNYYERHIGDYLKDTAHLSLLEHGIYTRLLDVYYTRESAIPVDQVARLVGARTKDEKDALQAVLNEFFELAGFGWAQDRCDREISRYLDKQRKAKASADARWSHTERNANALPTHSEGNAPQSPVTRHQTPVTKKTGGDSGAAQALTPPPAYLGEKNEAEIPAKAKVVLALGWELPEGWGNDAEALGFTPTEILHEAERFRQYFVAGKGQGTRRGLKGWRQGWSNWLANTEKYRRAA